MGVFGDALVVLGKWLCLVGLWSSYGSLLTFGVDLCDVEG